MQLQRFSQNSEIKPALANEKRRLWVPKNRFYEGIDAVMPNEGICLQMTTSSSHAVSVKTVVDFIDQNCFQPEFVDAMVATRHALWATYGFPKRIARIDLVGLRRSATAGEDGSIVGQASACGGL